MKILKFMSSNLGLYLFEILKVSCVYTYSPDVGKKSQHTGRRHSVKYCTAKSLKKPNPIKLRTPLRKREAAIKRIYSPFSISCCEINNDLHFNH